MTDNRTEYDVMRNITQGQSQTISNLNKVVDSQQAAIERVRALHFYDDETGYCDICVDFDYPCKTIKALDGEQ